MDFSPGEAPLPDSGVSAGPRGSMSWPGVLHCSRPGPSPRDTGARAPSPVPSHSGCPVPTCLWGKHSLATSPSAGSAGPDPGCPQPAPHGTAQGAEQRAWGPGCHPQTGSGQPPSRKPPGPHTGPPPPTDGPAGPAKAPDRGDGHTLPTAGSSQPSGYGGRPGCLAEWTASPPVISVLQGHGGLLTPSLTLGTGQCAGQQSSGVCRPHHTQAGRRSETSHHPGSTGATGGGRPRPAVALGSWSGALVQLSQKGPRTCPRSRGRVPSQQPAVLCEPPPPDPAASFCGRGQPPSPPSLAPLQPSQVPPLAHHHSSGLVDTGWRDTSFYWVCRVSGQHRPLSRPSGVSVGTQARGHAAEEPRDTKDDTEGLGDIRVVCEGLGAIQGQVHDLNEFAFLSQAPTQARPLGVCHLCIEHGLAGAGQSHARPTGQEESAEPPTQAPPATPVPSAALSTLLLPALW